MAWVEIMPAFDSLFQGWESAAPFLEWTGILVNRHRHRQVEDVNLPEAGSESTRGFFLKKEFAVTWHERFLNAWHGFGWCATAVREAAILIAAKEAGVGCADVVAFGEHERSSFVLLRAESDMTELPTLASDTERGDLAESLGRALAKLHAAGFEHPDLFAKHILVEPATQRICILDWARARRRRSISWRTRLRDLAVLDATLNASSASDRWRLRCLRAYLKAIDGGPPLARTAAQIRGFAEAMCGKRNLREIAQPTTPAHDQQFVPACDGRLLIVRSYYEKCDGKLPDWLANLPASESHSNDTSRFLVGASGSEFTWVQTWQNKPGAWQIPQLAHTLFRLARFGVPTPRLLAVGATPSRVFAATQAEATTPLDEAFAKASPQERRQLLEQAGRIVRQIHEAGYALPPGEVWLRRLGVNVATGAVVLARVEPLVRGNQAWRDIAPTEFNLQRFHLSRAEQLRFLRGYLGAEMKQEAPGLGTSTERHRAA